MRVITLLTILVLLTACGGQKSEKENADGTNSTEIIEVGKKDVHSFANFKEVNTTHLHLDLKVDFDKQIITGVADHKISNNKNVEHIIFDTKNLNIEKITLDGEKEASYSFGQKNDMLGTPLKVSISPDTKSVQIHYSTNKGAQALQFLNPQQTKGKEHPYLFTQGQAILTRTWIPTQDTPANRITYSADIKVPKELMAVMSASNPQEKNDKGEYHFEMNQPIPAYLIALAVGNLEFQEVGPRTGVYSEPSMIEASAAEFVDMENMLEVTEELYGPYKWDRYDVIVLPPSFPFGGMENPRLTFATPTIITGDRSLVSLIAHEMAHSWSGNLVTNATWNDFWMNEGFTVYIESRIMEALYGKEYSDMLTMLSYQDLEEEIEGMMTAGKSEDTHLKLDLEGRDPDEGMTSIAYDKGMFLLKSMEAAVGREKFDPFLKAYFNDYTFKTVTTEDFIQYANDNLLTPNNVDFNMEAWIYNPGIPANCAKFSSDRFIKVDEKLAALKDGKSPESLNVPKEKWTTHEWVHFVRNLPEGLDKEDMAALNEEFDFNKSTNSEVVSQWFIQAIKKDYYVIEEEMESFLINVGRRKFLEPIYKQLSKTDKGMKIAQDIYEKARPNYHPISYLTIDELLNFKTQS